MLKSAGCSGLSNPAAQSRSNGAPRRFNLVAHTRRIHGRPPSENLTDLSLLRGRKGKERKREGAY